MAYEWLLNLPVWLELLIMSGVAGLGSVVLTATLRRIKRTHHVESHNEVLGLVFATCGVIYAVLLAFVVFAVYDQYQKAEGIVNEESAALVDLYWKTERYPEPVRSATEQSIREYTRSVVNDEFPRMQRGEPSPTTRARLNRMDQMNARFQPPDPNGVQLASNSDRLIDRITVLRAERIAASRASLPMTFWLVLILGGAATIALGASLYMRPALHQLFGSFLLGLTIGAVLFLILSLDRPFTGTTAISSAAFQGSLQGYSNIDEINRSR